MRAVLLGEAGPVRRFAQLRLRQMATALPGAVVVDAGLPEAGARAEAEGGDFVVTAGNGPPLRAAVRAAGARPLWLDLPGDPFAEAEIAAQHAADPAVVLAEAAAAVLPALMRADAISVISERQRIATEAMLRALGRFEVPVRVLPIAMDFGLPAGPARGPGGAVALIGGFNHWLDEARLAEVLLRARRRAPLRIIATEGAIPGHHLEGWARFRARMGDALEMLGEVGHEALPAALAGASLSLLVDRPCREAELGSRTRVLFARHLGLRVVATPATELVAGLAAEGQVDAAWEDEALVEALLAARPAPDAEVLRRRWSLEATTAPLRAWRPRRAPGAGAEALAQLVQARDAALAELAAMHASPTWKLLDRLHRLRGRAIRGRRPDVPG